MAGMTKEQMMMSRVYTIYKHTLPDGSAYIGMTSEEKLNRRFQGGSDNVYNQEFHKAVYELGWKQVKTERLAEIYGTWYEAHKVEVKEIQRAIAAGIVLYNKEHSKPPKEYKYNVAGVTLIDINRYFPTLRAAAEYIGVTSQAIGLALKENRPCKGYSLAIGDVTEKEEKENV